MTMPINFAAFILTNGRPNKVYTYKTLRSHGYTGKIYLIVDDLDNTKDKYIEKYGNEVIIFNKIAIAKTFDQGDNFNDMRAIIYARNASFSIAKKIGLKHFIQLDDDYKWFQFRFNKNLNYAPRRVNDLNYVFKSLINYYESTSLSTIALAQGGDFIGGDVGNNPNAKIIKLNRKCMNSFLCSTNREFQFVGRVNEDVNTYTYKASIGLLLFTTNQISLEQIKTQSNSGGMTEMYLDSGTYIKSFYSVMYQPSSVIVKLMGNHNRRLHHFVKWINTVPLILNESLKKTLNFNEC